MTYLCILIIALFAGITQSVTGFGGAVFAMLFLPHIYPMTIAPAIANALCIPLSFSIALKYRHTVKKDKLFVPLVFYLVASFIAIRASLIINLNSLKIVFGFVLIFLSIFYSFLAARLHVKGGFLSAAICSFVSGLLGGFFGIGGPFLVLYYLTVTDDKEEYLGTINVVFAVVTVYQAIVRIFNGPSPTEYLPAVAVGIPSILMGSFVGSQIVSKVNIELLKKIIYVFLGISGVITVMNAL